MGTWDAGPFDNDHAADWCGDLDEAAPDERAALIRRTLAEVANVDDPDSDSGATNRAIAAAAVVAAVRHRLPLDSVYAPDFLTDGGTIDLPADISALAGRAVERAVADGSECRALWEEAGAWEQVLAALAPVRRALAT